MVCNSFRLSFLVPSCFLDHPDRGLIEWQSYTSLSAGEWPASPIAIQPVKLTVNGDPRELAHGSTVAALLENLDLAGKFVAVEVNLELVPKAQHTDRVLTDGDRVEIVTLVGGG